MRWLKPKVLHARLHNVILRQHDDGFNERSPFRVRPPHIWHDGISLANATKRSIARSSTTVSGFKSSIFLPRASLTARIFARAKPTFSFRTINLTSGNSASIAVAESSSELL